MTASNFLQLTNRVLNAFNEVELNSTQFASTSGFYTEAKNAVNQGLFDVYSYENVKWPFLFATQTFTATRGVFNYTLTANGNDIDWNSFRVNREQYTLSSLTQTGGLATATTTTPTTIQTGDVYFVDGATPAGYNTTGTAVTITGSNTFTFSVDPTLTSPATGTIKAYSNTVQWNRLWPVDINEYRQNWGGIVENQTSSQYDQPKFIVKTQDNNLIMFYSPDRTYTISYDSFVVPVGLVAYNDTHLIPEKYEQAIVDMALHYAYMFRDNSDEATAATTRGEARIRRMRKDLMPVQSDVNFG